MTCVAAVPRPPAICSAPARALPEPAFSSLAPPERLIQAGGDLLRAGAGRCKAVLELARHRPAASLPPPAKLAGAGRRLTQSALELHGSRARLPETALEPAEVVAGALEQLVGLVELCLERPEVGGLRPEQPGPGDGVDTGVLRELLLEALQLAQHLALRDRPVSETTTMLYGEWAAGAHRPLDRLEVLARLGVGGQELSGSAGPVFDAERRDGERHERQRARCACDDRAPQHRPLGARASRPRAR